MQGEYGRRHGQVIFAELALLTLSSYFTSRRTLDDCHEAQDFQRYDAQSAEQTVTDQVY